MNNSTQLPETRRANPMEVQAADKRDNSITEYVPFGGGDKIKLSITIVRNLLCKPTRQGALCSPNDALKFIAKCQAKRLNPFEDDVYLVGYDGRNGAEFSQIVAHQAFLKRAEASEQFDGLESGVILMRESGEIIEREGDFTMEHEAIVGGWAKVYLKHRGKIWYKRVALRRFAKDNDFWNRDPAGMIVKCAEADALRSAFPTVLGGLYIEQELMRPTELRVVKSVPANFDGSVQETLPQPGKASGPGTEDSEKFTPFAPEAPSNPNPQEGATPPAGPAAAAPKKKTEPKKAEPKAETPAPEPQPAAEATSTEPIQQPNWPRLTPAEIVGWILDQAIAANVFEDKILELARKRSLAGPNQTKLEMLGTAKLIQIGQNIDWFLAQAKMDQRGADEKRGPA